MYYRVSIIPYTWIQGELYVGLGLDSRYKEIADFGGKTDFYDQQLLSTAIREYTEETSAPIDFDFETLIKYEDKQHTLFFIRTMPYVMTNYIQYVNNREISQGFVIRWDDFKSLINGSTYKTYNLWSVISDILKPEIDEIHATILKNKEEPVPLIPEIVPIKEETVYYISDCFPSSLVESNKRYTIVDDSYILLPKGEFLGSKFTRPHLRQIFEQTSS